jgi:hypothetical protein
VDATTLRLPGLVQLKMMTGERERMQGLLIVSDRGACDPLEPHV